MSGFTIEKQLETVDRLENIWYKIISGKTIHLGSRCKSGTVSQQPCCLRRDVQICSHWSI